MTEKQSKKKLLIVSGPTAVGKTSLALQLAKLLGGEVISADSRQVYKGMDIGTGKEWGTKSKKQKAKSKIHIWGYDLRNPNEEWSAAHFVKFATRVITDIQKRGKLSIIVGGTGLYIKNLLNPPQTLFVTPDKKLRERLQQMTVPTLQAELQQINPERFEQMNESDRENPRRLVRAIEVSSVIPANAGIYKNYLYRSRISSGMTNVLHLALMTSIDSLDERIEERVRQRLNQGVEQEVRQLAKRHGWDNALSYTIAYREWKPYFEGKKTREDVITLWTTHERQYARRQLTWLRKQPNLQWFDIASPKYPQTVVSVVRQWYDETQHGR